MKAMLCSRTAHLVFAIVLAITLLPVGALARSQPQNQADFIAVIQAQRDTTHQEDTAPAAVLSPLPSQWERVRVRAPRAILERVDSARSEALDTSPSRWPATTPGAFEVRPFMGWPAVTVAGPDLDAYLAAAPQPSAPGVQAPTFVINWNPADRCQSYTYGAVPLDWTNEAKTAFNNAAGIWASLLRSSVPIEVDACMWSTLFEGVLGIGSPSAFAKNFPNAPQADTWYPAALANALTGSDLVNGPELQVGFNGGAGTYYLLSTALHELGHGLGFIGGLVSSSNVAFCANRGWVTPYCPTIYDRFAVDRNGVNLYASMDEEGEDPRIAGRALVSETYFSGANAVAQNNGNRVRLHTPTPWNQGVSYSHLDSSFSGTADNLMIASGATAQTPGPVTLGMFRDMGWTLTGNWPYVELAGPVSGTAKSTYSYIAAFSPVTTSLPITYTWTATDLPPVTHAARGVSDTLDLNWTTPGTKNVVVTASGFGLPVSTTLTVSMNGVAVSGPVSGSINIAYSYAASFSPAGTTKPLTYTWQATGLSTVVHTGKGTTDSAQFTWTEPETKTLTVTVSGSGPPVSDTISVYIRPLSNKVYLPTLLRVY